MLSLVLVASLLQTPESGALAQEPPSAPHGGVILSGEPLHAELSCVRCHGSFPSASAPQRIISAPSLDEVGAQRTPDYLREYLSDPLHVRPGTRMPDMLAGLGEEQRTQTVEDLVHYLATRGGPFQHVEFGAGSGLLEEGRQLYHEVGCVACHGPEEKLEALYELLDLTQPSELGGGESGSVIQLLDLPRKTSVGALSQFLLDPVKTRRSGRMPSLSLTEDEATAISTYLLRGQITVDSGLEPKPGLQMRYYEFAARNDPPQVEGKPPLRESLVLDELGLPEHREDNFVVVFEGLLRIEEAGGYRFRTRSDDGSMLYLDGELIVSNGGNHAPQSAQGQITLARGLHELRITFYEHAGGEELAVEWSGPGFEFEPLRGDDCVHMAYTLAPPASGFRSDAQRAARGKELFESLHCAACHEPAPRAALPYGELDANEPGGCLSDEPIAGVPHFGLALEQHAELVAALSRPSAPPPREATPEEDVERVLQSARCDACHVRGEDSGPEPELRGFFFSNGEVDLGEEGRIPPHLIRVGAKLNGEALRRVLREGEAVRPYLVTRMPQFGPEVLGDIELALQAADTPNSAPPPPAFDAALAKAGQQLVGTRGFGCIQCHSFDGYESLGIPAVDLALVDGRIQFPWFRELLLDPGGINMNTRMPGFWIDGESPVKDVLEGDKEAQIAAVWCYLSQGSSMPLPHGLVVADSAFELAPDDVPLMVGVFMRGVSPRTVAVGLPENIHYAFDLENSRLAMVWRGRFFNARGTWQGRAGQLEGPASDDVLQLPEAPAFALIEDEDSPWPVVEARAPKLRALGRSYDEARRPIFRYALGEIVIEEHLQPLVRDGRSALQRNFRFSSPAPVEQLTFLKANDERVRITFQPDPVGEGFVAELTTEIAW